MPPSDVASEPRAWPRVSIIIPCRREAEQIRRVLTSVLDTTYPRDRLEILVLDGMSDDGTREAAQEIASREPVVRLIDNPRRIIPAALNLGLAEATGEVIVRMDAHTTYPPEYVQRCVAGLLDTGADNVGGVCELVPRDATLMGRTLARVLSHPFGIGNAQYRLNPRDPVETDTVPFGCMWRTTMLAVGPFDERFARSEDMDFNARIRAGGGRILLLPEIRSFYQVRSRLGPFVRHTLSNGYWVFFPLAFTRLPVRWRHYVPLLFLLSLVGPTLATLRWPLAIYVAALSAGAYVVANLAASIGSATEARDARFVLTLPPAFALLHLLYGAGSAWGLARALWYRLRAASRNR